MNFKSSGDILHSFLLTCFNYLTTNLKIPDEAKRMYYLHKRKNKLTTGDFYFSGVSSSRQNLNLCLSDREMVLEELSGSSQHWPLRVCKVSQSENLGTAIFLDRHFTFKHILKTTLELCGNYGQYPQKNQTVSLTADCDVPEENLDLTTYRVRLQKQFAQNILSSLGYQVVEMTQAELAVNNVIELHVYSDATSVDRSYLPPSCKRFVCGAVLSGNKSVKERRIMAADYFKMRLKDMEAISEHKYGNKVKMAPEWGDLLNTLADGAVKMDLLSTKPRDVVALNLEPNFVSSRASRNKGGTFVLYNCARISEIMKQFDLKVADGIYPPLVSIDNVDFSLLSTEEEWELLFNYVLVYPTMVRESCEKLSEGILFTEKVCDFLVNMCYSFSSYYRRFRVLTEPRSHLLPQMYARLYLLKAIHQVMHNALRLLDISPVSQM